MSIEFTVNGRKVRPEDFGRELTRSVEASVSKSMEQRIRSTRCPVHGQSIQNLQVSRMGSQTTWTGDACCDQLQQAINRAFA